MFRSIARLMTLAGMLLAPGLGLAQTTDVQPQLTPAPIHLPTQPDLLVRDAPHVKRLAPAFQRIRISPTLKIPEPTVVEKAEEVQQQPKPMMAVTLRDTVDARKYGFADLPAMKVAARQALGLPKDFPLYIREEVIEKNGERRTGLAVSGASPLLVGPTGAPLSLEEFRKRLTLDAGSVLGK